MIEQILAIQYNGIIAIVAYWIPMLLCLVGYTCKTWKEYREEVERSKKLQASNVSYTTNLTIGVIVNRICATFLPVLNIVAIAFDIGWPMVSTLVRMVTNILDIPLIKPYVSTPKPK